MNELNTYIKTTLVAGYQVEMMQIVTASLTFLSLGALTMNVRLLWSLTKALLILKTKFMGVVMFFVCLSFKI